MQRQCNLKPRWWVVHLGVKGLSMSLVILELPADVRAKLALDGRKFGSPDVLKQIDQAVKGFDMFLVSLSPHGFVAKDVALLKEVQRQLEEKLSGRVDVQLEKKGMTLDERALVGVGKMARSSARSVVTNALAELQLTGAAQALQTPLIVVLKDTRLTPKVSVDVADQLERLSKVLGAEALKEVVQERGGGDLAASLAEKAMALREMISARTQPLGTPEQTEALDVLDGLAVSLLRRARRAASAATRATGNRAITDAFKLTHLY